jgi:hypothetical protein
MVFFFSRLQKWFSLNEVDEVAVEAEEVEEEVEVVVVLRLRPTRMEVSVLGQTALGSVNSSFFFGSSFSNFLLCFGSSQLSFLLLLWCLRLGYV